MLIKKKKINSKSRLFDKKLGGGCILDLGCYPISFSLLIGSLIAKLDKKDISILNIKKEIGETNVDIDASAEINFKSGFNSKIKSSFKKNLGSESNIIGEKGTITINNTWFGNDKIIRSNNNNHHLIKNQNHQNIYSYQIQNISKNIVNGISKSQYPAMSLNETLLNMKLIDSWLDG